MKSPGNGISHVFHAFSYSMAGARVLLGETAARLELLFYVPCVAILYFFNAPLTDYLSVTILFFVLLSVEALNTAIENIVDNLSPEQSTFAKQTKDLGSFAVFCLLASIAIYLMSVVFSQWPAS